MAFFPALLGWFALAPLSLEVSTSMEICKNRLFPPKEPLPRPANFKFSKLKTGLVYCQYGAIKEDGKLTDCKDVTAGVATEDAQRKYRSQVLENCVRTLGTKCKSVIAYVGVASVASTIFVRVAPGTLLERFGPVKVQCGLLTFSAFWVAMAAEITVPWNCTLIRSYIGCAGATFVSNLFCCSLMFAPHVVGTANATAVGWGNLGGGVTQIFMMLVLFNQMTHSGMEPNVAWRLSMIVPAVMFAICAICMKLLCWDMPTGKIHDPAITGKSQKPGMCDILPNGSSCCGDVGRSVRTEEPLRYLWAESPATSSTSSLNRSSTGA